MKLFKLNENVVKLLSCEEVATYAVIANAKTSKNSCYCYEKYIADKLSITDRTVKNHIKTLAEAGAFTISTENVSETTKRRNIYTFKDDKKSFILVESAILDSNLTNAEIGLLIKIKVECLSNSLNCFYSLNKLATILHIGKAKLSKLINSLSEKKHITKTDAAYTINSFFSNTSKVVAEAKVKREKQLIEWNKLYNENRNNDCKVGKLFREYNNKLDAVKNPASLAFSILTGCYGTEYQNTKLNKPTVEPIYI